MGLWLDRTSWRVGQRVARTNSDELGVIADIGLTGVVKVKWDRGRTSYFRPEDWANVKLAKSADKME
jgi:hypothetical protein